MSHFPDTDFATLHRLVEADRSIRRFDNSRPIDRSVLEQIVGLVRYCPSGRNMQPLRYRIVDTPAGCDAVYPLLKWAGYLSDWDGPVPAERPVAYLVQCLDTSFGPSCLCDDGIQLQTITLGATALGLGACIIKAFNAPALIEALQLPLGMKPLYVLALGYPVEKVEIETTDGAHDADIRYYRTPDGIHHVPKRPVGELII